MSDGSEDPGHHERLVAGRLIEGLPPAAASVLSWHGIDLVPAAEHILYTAMRRESTERPGRGLGLRALARIARAATLAGTAKLPPKAGADRVLALVTLPVHAALLAPVASQLARSGVTTIVVDAETRADRRVDHPTVDARLLAFLRATGAMSLASHALRVSRRMRSTPPAWDDIVGGVEARRLWAALRAGLPLVALDAARLASLLERTRPRLVVCFSESGLLARVAPAVADQFGIPAVDLPHGEAADPAGATGIGYAAVAVYGPRSRQAMVRAGVDPDRIVEIGPLRFDRLMALVPTSPSLAPRRVVFASQPADPSRTGLDAAAKRAALSAAMAVTQGLAPAELVVVPHPIEPVGEAEHFLEGIERSTAVAVRVERDRGLHDVLAGAWLLVTISSQSVFDAVLMGIPAVTVIPPGSSSAVDFAAEGIAFEVAGDTAARDLATSLASEAERASAAGRAREALGDRIGPLDGRAAERAAELLVARMGRREHP